jgi:hypothetical protein
MKRKIIVLGTVVILLMVVLSGYNELTDGGLSDEEEKFVGTWIENYQEIDRNKLFYTFFSDKTYSQSGQGGTWKLKEGKLLLESSYTEPPFLYDYYFSENDTILNLKWTSSDSYTEYLKQLKH